MKLFLYFIPILFFYACQSQEASNQEKTKPPSKLIDSSKDTAILAYYEQNKGNKKPSKSSGKVSSGTLTNGKLLPFYGSNFSYFDKSSYLGGRAYLNDKVLTTVIESYKQLEKEIPHRHFIIMETANQKGGELYPHRTHQNGLSVDFMMPLTQNKQPYYKLDSLGTRHYLLAFNNEGEYANDTTVKVNFNLIAHHILILNQEAKKVGLKIKKVIIKIEYKDELFATEYGKKLKASGVYVVKGLSKMINALHDEHYHIDFGEV